MPLKLISKTGTKNFPTIREIGKKTLLEVTPEQLTRYMEAAIYRSSDKPVPPVPNSGLTAWFFRGYGKDCFTTSGDLTPKGRNELVNDFKEQGLGDEKTPIEIIFKNFIEGIENFLNPSSDKV